MDSGTASISVMSHPSAWEKTADGNSRHVLMSLPIRSTGENLWDQAIARLSPADKELLDFADRDKSTVLSDLLALTKKRRTICIQKRLKYVRKSGEVVVFRDVFDKIIASLEKFLQIGDIIAQYDPSHAAIPWAGVRLILQVICLQFNGMYMLTVY